MSFFHFRASDGKFVRSVLNALRPIGMRQTAGRLFH